ncbi:MAG: hypothetical protein QM767_19705 [Anaeromyxobacter sp.]
MREHRIPHPVAVAALLIAHAAQAGDIESRWWFFKDRTYFTPALAESARGHPQESPSRPGRAPCRRR